MKQRLVLVVLFLIGCATGGLASQLVVPPARAGTNPVRWEYLCAETPQILTTDMTRLGTEGWEMVSLVPSHQDHQLNQDLRADSFVYCFKRPLP